MLLTKGKQLAPLPLRRFDPPGLNGPLFQRQGRVGDDQLRVNIDRAAKPTAGIACAERAVEREHIRHGLLIGDTARRALKLVRERHSSVFIRENQRQTALTILKGLFARVVDALFGAGGQGQTVNQNGTGFRLRLGSVGQFLNIDRLTSHNDPMETGLQQTVADFLPGQAGRR